MDGAMEVSEEAFVAEEDDTFSARGGEGGESDRDVFEDSAGEGCGEHRDVLVEDGGSFDEYYMTPGQRQSSEGGGETLYVAEEGASTATTPSPNAVEWDDAGEEGDDEDEAEEEVDGGIDGRDPLGSDFSDL